MNISIGTRIVLAFVMLMVGLAMTAMAHAAPQSTAWDVIVRYPGGSQLQWYGCTMYSEEQSNIASWSPGYIEANCEGSFAIEDEVDWNGQIDGLPTLRLHLNDGYHNGCRLIYRQYASYNDTGSLLVDCELIYKSGFGRYQP